MLTAEEEIRQALTGNPFSEPHFQHEGEEVTRWITGGTLPDVYVTLHHQDDMIEVRCSTCKATLGHITADFGENMSQQLVAIRQAEHQHK